MSDYRTKRRAICDNCEHLINKEDEQIPGQIPEGLRICAKYREGVKYGPCERCDKEEVQDDD